MRPSELIKSLQEILSEHPELDNYPIRIESDDYQIEDCYMYNLVGLSKDILQDEQGIDLHFKWSD